MSVSSEVVRGFFAEDEGPLGRRAVALDLELQVAEADLAVKPAGPGR